MNTGGGTTVSTLYQRYQIQQAQQLNDRLIAAIREQGAGQTKAIAGLAASIDGLRTELSRANIAYGQELRLELLSRFATLPKNLAADEAAYKTLKEQLTIEVDQAMAARSASPKKE